MNHQPFEDWLLSDDRLTPDEEQALQVHLQNCEECPQIEAAWQEVRHEFQSAPQVSPGPGFVNRWEARLAQERAAQQRKLVLVGLGITLLGAAGSTGILIAQNWNTLPTPLDILARTMLVFSGLMSGLQDLTLFVRVLFTSFPPIISVGIWIALTTTLVVWVAIWFLTVWKIPSIKRSLT